MDVLNSNFLNSVWLVKMLEKSSKSPRARLLNLFDILEDWLDAPIVAPSLSPSIRQSPNDLQTQNYDKVLQKFLTLEAAKAGAAMPEMLANQLYFMAIAAAQEKLQANNTSSLSHAKNAASALITAQTSKQFHVSKKVAYAMVASFLLVTVTTGSLFMLNLNQHTKQKIASNPQVPVGSIIPQLVAADTIADPEQTVALMAQIEQMRHGNCQLIEAIQLPDSQKGIYLNMVVNGQVSTNRKEQVIALDLLQRTRCNYAPMLMANSR